MNNKENTPPYSCKSGKITIVLFILFCYIGGHLIYVGKLKKAIKLIFLEAMGITLISVKYIIIASYYQNISYGKSYYYFNIIGTIGYICFIIALVSLVKDFLDILSSNFKDNKSDIVKF